MFKEKWRLPVLLSFAYYKKAFEICKGYYKKAFDLHKLGDDFFFIIDSGAFSIKNSGKKLFIEDYCDFVKEYVPSDVRYFNFDVIGDSSATFKNLIFMRKKGLRPIPIITKDDDLPMIERYYIMSPDYVGFGGLKDADMGVSIGDRKHIKWLMQEGCKGRPSHWLGFCNPDFIKYYKPTSCDSLTWKQAQIYGKIYVLTESGMHLISRQQILNAKLNIRHGILAAGFDIGDLYTKENWYGGDQLAQFISTVMYIKFVKKIQEKVGTNMHLVIGNQQDFDMLLKAKHYLEKRGEL